MKRVETIPEMPPLAEVDDEGAWLLITAILKSVATEYRMAYEASKRRKKDRSLKRAMKECESVFEFWLGDKGAGIAKMCRDEVDNQKDAKSRTKPKK